MAAKGGVMFTEEVPLKMNHVAQREKRGKRKKNIFLVPIYLL